MKIPDTDLIKQARKVVTKMNLAEIHKLYWIVSERRRFMRSKAKDAGLPLPELYP